MAITRTVLPCIALLCSLAPAASAATLTFEDPDGDKYGTFVLTATESGGNDRLLGGPDEDELVGGEGAQELRGGTENDTIDGDFFAVAYGGDVIDGGPGTDTGGGRYRPSDEESTPPISVTQDGAANDGREGEQDDVTSIERISTGGTTGAFHGTEGADEFKLHLRRGSTTRLYGGDDRFDGANSAETVDGGAGADDLRGGFGHDTITGGPGQDVIDGDGGSYCHLWGCSVPYGNDVCCRVSGRLLLGGRAVATGTTALLEAGTATVVLRVTAKARRRLRRLRGARLKLRVALVDENDGTARFTRTLVFKR